MDRLDDYHSTSSVWTTSRDGGQVLALSPGPPDGSSDESSDKQMCLSNSRKMWGHWSLTNRGLWQREGGPPNALQCQVLSCSRCRNSWVFTVHGTGVVGGGEEVVVVKVEHGRKQERCLAEGAGREV